MSVRTTDNFLARGQDETSYVPRPPLHTRRRLAAAPRPPAIAVSPPSYEADADASTAETMPIAPSMQTPLLKLKKRFPQKRLLYKLTVMVLLLGSAVFLAKLRTDRQPIGHVAAQRLVVAAKPVLPAKFMSVNIGLPVRLKIPKIGVDAAVDHLGLTPEGDMDTPKGPDTAGWFSPGPRPGETGSAVIDGHFGWKNNLPAVFDNLHTLQKNDTIIVEGDTGHAATFTVRELRTYGRNDIATDAFRSSDGKAHLNLITCHGSWSEQQKSYSNRLVVLTDLRVDD